MRLHAHQRAHRAHTHLQRNARRRASRRVHACCAAEGGQQSEDVTRQRRHRHTHGSQCGAPRRIDAGCKRLAVACVRRRRRWRWVQRAACQSRHQCRCQSALPCARFAAQYYRDARLPRRRSTQRVMQHARHLGIRRCRTGRRRQHHQHVTHRQRVPPLLHSRAHRRRQRLQQPRCVRRLLPRQRHRCRCCGGGDTDSGSRGYAPPELYECELLRGWCAFVYVCALPPAAVLVAAGLPHRKMRLRPAVGSCMRVQTRTPAREPLPTTNTTTEPVHCLCGGHNNAQRLPRCCCAYLWRGYEPGAGLER